MYSGAIILAAGSSSRMGKSKQMLDIQGEKLLVKTVQTVLHADVSAVTVVLGAKHEMHRELIKDLPIDIVYNEQWPNGMGSSLKKGLLHLTSKHPSLEALIVLVCDQPMLTSDNIRNLITRYEETGKPVIASRYGGMPGVPALFNKTYFEKLAMLPDDAGAKKIILQNQADVSQVDFPGGEVDLDTMQDYDSFVKRHP